MRASGCPVPEADIINTKAGSLTLWHDSRAARDFYKLAMVIQTPEARCGLLMKLLREHIGKPLSFIQD